MSALHVLVAAALVTAAHAASAQAPAVPADAAPSVAVTPGVVAAPGGAVSDLDPDAHFKGRMGGTFGKNITEVMPAGKRIAVAAFRVAFITDNSISAQVRGSYLPGRDTSGARSSLYLTLKGVDPKTMQAVTDKAYADLLAQLAASGREVVPLDQLKDFFASATPTQSPPGRPYTKEQNGQTASFFAPTGMPLVFIHLDGQWGNLSAFDLNNYRRLEEASSKLNAVVLAPLVVVNFAKMSSSGNQSGLTSRSAETGAELSMSVVHLQSFYARTEEFRNGMLMKGDEGAFTLGVPIASPLQFGTMTKTAQEDNAAIKGIFDVLGRSAGLANAGGAARSVTRAVAETNDDAYAAAASDALGRMSSTIAKWFKKYPPAN